MKASKCSAAACRFILSTSRPEPSGEAGELRVPVVVMPVRSMTHRRAGHPIAACHRAAVVSSGRGPAWVGSTTSVDPVRVVVARDMCPTAASVSGASCRVVFRRTIPRGRRATRSISASAAAPVTPVNTRRNRRAVVGAKETDDRPARQRADVDRHVRAVECEATHGAIRRRRRPPPAVRTVRPTPTHAGTSARCRAVSGSATVISIVSGCSPCPAPAGKAHAVSGCPSTGLFHARCGRRAIDLRRACGERFGIGLRRRKCQDRHVLEWFLRHGQRLLERDWTVHARLGRDEIAHGLLAA